MTLSRLNTDYFRGFKQNSPVGQNNCIGLNSCPSFGHVQRFIQSEVLRVSKIRHEPFVIAATDLCFVQGHLLIHYTPVETVWDEDVLRWRTNTGEIGPAHSIVRFHRSLDWYSLCISTFKI